MCETLIVQCPFCHFVALKWTTKYEARLADVPYFRFDLEYRSSGDFDRLSCEYCAAHQCRDGSVKAAPRLPDGNQAVLESYSSNP